MRSPDLFHSEAQSPCASMCSGAVHKQCGHCGCRGDYKRTFKKNFTDAKRSALFYVTMQCTGILLALRVHRFRIQDSTNYGWKARYFQDAMPVDKRVNFVSEGSTGRTAGPE